MMKRRILVIISVLLLIIFTFSACSSSVPQKVLSEEEVAALREENDYRIYGGELNNASVSEDVKTLREFIIETDTFVFCEVVKEPEFVEVFLESGFSEVDNDGNNPTARVHTVKVIKDSESIYTKGEVITFFYGLAGQEDCPSPKKGEKILIPMRDAYATSPADGKSSYYGYYYVTESDNVISAFKEEEKSIYSGETVNRMLSILKKTDEERDIYLAEEKRMYERSGGKYGFTSIEMLREQIKEKLEAKKNAEK